MGEKDQSTSMWWSEAVLVLFVMLTILLGITMTIMFVVDRTVNDISCEELRKKKETSKPAEEYKRRCETSKPTTIHNATGIRLESEECSDGTEIGAKTCHLAGGTSPWGKCAGRNCYPLCGILPTKGCWEWDDLRQTETFHLPSKDEPPFTAPP